MEERKTKVFRRLWQAVIKQIRNWHFDKRGKRIFWVGDITGAAVLHPSNQHLRAINLHGKDFLKTFFKKELEGRLGFGKTPLLLSLDISMAEAIRIAERIKRYQEEKRANFISCIRRYGKYKRESE